MRDSNGRYIKGHTENTGKSNAFYGIGPVKKGSKRPPFSDSWKNKLKLAAQKNRFKKLGSLGTGWIDGRTPLAEKLRKLPEYKEWRKSVFIRDNYKCVECGLCNGHGKTVRLEAHHEITFSNILSDFLKEFSQFSPIEDYETLVRLAISYKPFWDLRNGKTLCDACHNLTKKGNIAW